MYIAIIGCGYVGKAIGLHLKSTGNQALTTTCDQNKAKMLEKDFDKVIVFDSRNDNPSFLSDCSTVIITVAPKIDESYEDAYFNTAKSICNNLTQDQRVIYTSSTSVYGDYEGQTVHEASPCIATHSNEKVLIKTEKEILSHKKSTILRLGEILGPGRNPVDRLKERKSCILINDGRNATNLIHVQDIVYCIAWVLAKKIYGILNLVNDVHMTRREYYTKLSKENDLPLPEFILSDSVHHGQNKRVANEKLKGLGFTLSLPYYPFEPR